MGFVAGGHLVARALKAEGVQHLFTLCGGHIQMVYDGCLDEGIRVVDVRHEQSAGHAADGMARATGIPGVAAVTAGPGITDVVTALANAQRAQVPMVVLGGQGARTLSQFGGQDRGSLQEMDHLALVSSVCKWARTVPETRRIPEYIQTAFRQALSGVPGPVFLELPLDVLFAGCPEEDVVSFPGPSRAPNGLPHPDQLTSAIDALDRADRPVLLVGSQWRWSSRTEGLEAVLQRRAMPTFLNGMARGALDWGHVSVFRRCRSKALRRADVAVVCGTPLDFRLKYGESIPAETKLIQVDLDGAEVGRNRHVDTAIVSDTGWFLQQLADGLSPKDTSGWLSQCEAWEMESVAKNEAEAADESDPINPLAMCRVLDGWVDDDTIVVGDGGDFVATAAYSLSPRGIGSWMDPGPLGTLGVGPGYAMAAKLAHPEKRVLLVSGDGTFGLNGFEFEAMARQNIPVVCVVGNDGGWTQIRRGQIEMYGEERAVATSLARTRYDQIAQAMGCLGEHVTKFSELRPAFERAFAADRPVVVNVEIGTSDFRKGALAV